MAPTKYLSVLLRLSRLKEYLPQLFLIFILIFLISPQNLLSYKTAIIFLANLFLTSFAYAINDVEDAEDDYHDLRKRKRNIISNGTIGKKYGYLISFSLLFTGLILLLLLNKLVFLVGLFLSFDSFLYSWKKLRLKSIPFLDLISHALCLGTLQFLTTYLAFRSLNWQIIPFLTVIIPFSFSTQILQELRDFKVDRKTKINNTAQLMGKKNSAALVYGFCVTLAIGFIFLTESLYLVCPIQFFPLAFLVPLFYFKIKHNLPLPLID